jgi:hypothetical protein
LKEGGSATEGEIVAFAEGQVTGKILKCALATEAQNSAAV